MSFRWFLLLFFCGFPVMAFTSLPRSAAMGGVGVASANKADATFMNPALLALKKGWGANIIGLGIGLTGSRSFVDDAEYLVNNIDKLTEIKSGNLSFDFGSDKHDGGTDLDQLNSILDTTDKSVDILLKAKPILEKVASLANNPLQGGLGFFVSAGIGPTGFFIHNESIAGGTIYRDIAQNLTHTTDSLVAVLANLKRVTAAFKRLQEQLQNFQNKFGGKMIPPMVAIPYDGNLPDQVCRVGICAQHKNVGGEDYYCIPPNPLLPEGRCVETKNIDGKAQACFNGMCMPLGNAGGGGSNPQDAQICGVVDGKQVCVDTGDLGGGGGTAGAGDSGSLFDQLAKTKANLENLKNLLENSAAAQVLIYSVTDFGIPYAYSIPLGPGKLAMGFTPKLQLFAINDALLFANENSSFSFTFKEKKFAADVDGGVAYRVSNLRFPSFWIPGTWTAALRVRNVIPFSLKTRLGSRIYQYPLVTLGWSYSNWGLTFENDLDLTSQKAPTASNGQALGYGSQALSVGAEYDLLGWASLRLGDRYDFKLKRNILTFGVGLFPLIHWSLSGGLARGAYYVNMAISLV